MMPFITAFIARVGLSRLLTFLGIAGGVLLAMVLIQHVISRHDERIVEADRIDATAEATNRVLQADREATANEMIRTEVIANNNEELRDEARKGDASSVGPGVDSLLDRMRQQQAAGRR